jgi:hypothetical protein
MQHRSLAAQISHGEHAVTPTVLVPVDGSEKDRRVIPAAAALAAEGPDVAEAVVRDSDVPVLLVKPREAS